MTIFEKITASPETLGELLASLTVINSPWEEAFHRAFCDSCIDSNGTENCDTPGCPHEAERNNPTWWLKLGTAEKTDAAKDGRCVDFNVYLGEKASGGLLLEGVEKVLMPEIATYDKGPLQAGMRMKLSFRSMGYAGPVIGKMRIPCTIEIRVAVQRWDKACAWKFDGQSYILEATPTEIMQEPLTRGGGTGAAVWFKVDNITANDEAGNQMWSFGKNEAGE